MLHTTGAFLIASALAGVLSGPLWGHMCRWSSRNRMLIGGAIVGANGLLLTASLVAGWTTASNLMVLTAHYFVLEFGYQGVRIGRKTYVVNVTDDHNRLQYVSIG